MTTGPMAVDVYFRHNHHGAWDWDSIPKETAGKRPERQPAIEPLYDAGPHKHKDQGHHNQVAPPPPPVVWPSPPQPGDVNRALITMGVIENDGFGWSPVCPECTHSRSFHAKRAVTGEVFWLCDACNMPYATDNLFLVIKSTLNALNDAWSAYIDKCRKVADRIQKLEYPDNMEEQRQILWEIDSVRRYRGDAMFSRADNSDIPSVDTFMVLVGDYHAIMIRKADGCMWFYNRVNGALTPLKGKVNG